MYRKFAHYVQPASLDRPLLPRTAGEMDDSYKFEEEDVNAKGAGGDENRDDKGDGGKTTKLSRKVSFARKRSSAAAGSSSAKKGGAKKTKK